MTMDQPFYKLSGDDGCTAGREGKFMYVLIVGVNPSPSGWEESNVMNLSPNG